MGGSAYISGVEYKEYDNFFVSPFRENGVVFQSTEHYYQYHKCVNDYDRNNVLTASIEDVYSVGQTVEITDNWEERKLDVMFQGNYLKFTQNENLRDSLCNTSESDMIDVPSNAFGSLFWGSGINGEGKNWNGKILMAVRDLLWGKSIDDFLFEKKYESFCLKMK